MPESEMSNQAPDTVEVSTTPINSGARLSSFLRPRARIADDRLILELDRGMRLLGSLFIVWGLLFATFGVLAVMYDWPREAVLVGFVPGTVCPLVGLFLMLLPCQCVFDRQEGTYRRRSLVAPEVRPLSEITAVQAIRGRVVETTDDGGTWRRQTYELNLVLAGGSGRLAVVCTTDDGWVDEAGRAVSAFLGVPFLCRIAERHP
jgi:hypothetical protein